MASGFRLGGNSSAVTLDDFNLTASFDVASSPMFNLAVSATISIAIPQQALPLTLFAVGSRTRLAAGIAPASHWNNAFGLSWLDINAARFDIRLDPYYQEDFYIPSATSVAQRVADACRDLMHFLLKKNVMPAFWSVIIVVPSLRAR